MLNFSCLWANILAVPVPDSIEDKVRDVAPTLDQIPKRSVLVCVHSYIHSLSVNSHLVQKR